MEKAARNIEDYQSRLMPEGKVWNVSGGVLGQLVRGLSRVGVYVPGGTAAYPSSVLMCTVPAQVAGVEEITLVTPPTKNLNEAVMAAAKIAGVHRVIAIGGAQAIASLTYGAGIVPKVDKVVGPGNAYVAAAKKLAFGEIDIDMVAGPSEILIIADDGANPVYCAADLLSQAEHDALSASILVTNSGELAEAVNAELKKQIAKLSRQNIIRKSLADYGAIIVVNDLDKAVKVANAVAPEHLEILTSDPWQLMPKIKNAGAIFLGESSPEPLGDYLAGPSHVLPTAGTARFFSPLSAESFIKKTSVIEYTRQGLRSISQDIVRFAEAEGLGAHANSVKVRFEKSN
jgi:histidinol dehydrogenase